MLHHNHRPDRPPELDDSAVDPALGPQQSGLQRLGLLERHKQDLNLHLRARVRRGGRLVLPGKDYGHRRKRNIGLQHRDVCLCVLAPILPDFGRKQDDFGVQRHKHHRVIDRPGHKPQRGEPELRNSSCVELRIRRRNCLHQLLRKRDNHRLRQLRLLRRQRTLLRQNIHLHPQRHERIAHLQFKRGPHRLGDGRPQHGRDLNRLRLVLRHQHERLTGAQHQLPGRQPGRNNLQRGIRLKFKGSGHPPAQPQPGEAEDLEQLHQREFL